MLSIQSDARVPGQVRLGWDGVRWGAAAGPPTAPSIEGRQPGAACRHLMAGLLCPAAPLPHASRYLPFADQYMRSMRLWDPASSAFVFSSRGRPSGAASAGLQAGSGRASTLPFGPPPHLPSALPPQPPPPPCRGRSVRGHPCQRAAAAAACCGPGWRRRRGRQRAAGGACRRAAPCVAGCGLHGLLELELMGACNLSWCSIARCRAHLSSASLGRAAGRAAAPLVPGVGPPHWCRSAPRRAHVAPDPCLTSLV